MRVIKIEGLTPELKEFEKAVFMVSDEDFLKGVFIYSESKSMGGCPRPDMTLEQFKCHLDNMRTEGFTVTEYEF